MTRDIQPYRDISLRVSALAPFAPLLLSTMIEIFSAIGPPASLCELLGEPDQRGR